MGGTRMAEGSILKDLIKPPFANYDVVVYFGVGIFFLPFLFHYIGADKLKLLSFQFDIKPDFASILVSSLSILFGVYILGHMIAYAGSQFVERLMDSIFGKTSTVVLMGSKDRGGSNPMFRKQVWARSAKSWKRSKWVLLFRLMIHLPVLVPYLVLYGFGAFGFYRTRISQEVMEAAAAEYQAAGLPGGPVDADHPWYKAVEAYVMNRYPVVTARMYNYLVIFGIFRSLCIVFLFALWFEMAYIVEFATSGATHPALFSLGLTGTAGQGLSYLVLVTLYVFSLFSYLKFQRRYVEEAIFGFVFAKSKPEAAGH